MRAIISNPPWIVGNKFGVRAASRWPHLRNDKILPFPIYHAYAAAVLENAGIDVKVIDAVDREMSITNFVESVAKFKPDYVFLEISYPSYQVDKKTIRELKNKTDVKIAVFGPDATARKDFLLGDCKEIDFVVFGEFDYTLLDLLTKKDLTKIRGIYHREKNKIKKNPPRELIQNLDELPMPARHLYPKNSYQEPLYYTPQYLIATSRGCPFGCSYCVYPQTISGRHFRKRSAKNIVDEMEYLVKKLRAKAINIDDDTFTVDTKRVKDICDEIIKRNLKITWDVYSSVNIQDIEMYQKMKKAGCEMIRFGVESANYLTQKNVNKNLSIEKIKKGFDLAEKQGLKTFGTFMFGLPGDTKESMEETIKLAIELNPFAVQFSYVVAYPGTSIYEEAKRKNWFTEENPQGFAGFFKPSILPYNLKLKDLDGIINKAYRKFYLRPKYLLKMIIKSRSLQDLKRLGGGGKSLLKRMIK